MSGDVTKLPKWAQDHIRRLEGALAQAHEVIEADVSDSDTLIRAAFREGAKGVYRGIGMTPTVLFDAKVDENGYTRESFQVRMIPESGVLHVAATDNLACLQIEPQATNVVHVRSARFKHGVRGELG